MDFYGILFDMKNGKKIPYSKNYFDTLFAAKLEELGVKTITGTLPLTFTISETALRSWTIYGNNTQHNYSAEGTLPLTFSTHTAGNADDWSISGNDNVGVNLFDESNLVTGSYYTAQGQTGNSNDWSRTVNALPVLPNTEYTFNPNSTAGASAKHLYLDADNNFITAIASGDSTFTTPSNCFYMQFSLRTSSTNVMLVRGSTAPDHYIPYQQGVGEQRVDGYYIPLTVSQQGQTDKTVDIYIGDSPLTEGETVSKTSTGVDLELFEGENTVSTTLYNKPETSITYTDYLGVGEYVNGQWQIPLTVTHYTDNIFDKDAKNANKGYEDSTCIMWAGSIPYPYMTGNIPEDNNCFVSEKIPASPNTTYYLTDGIFKNTDNGIYSVFLWNRFRMSDYQAFPTEKTFTTGDDTKFIQLCVLKSYADTVMITTKPTSEYIPHKQSTDYTIPIDAPLTEGQSVSDTVEITAYEGTNTLDTTLTVRPDATITYK